MGLLRVWVFNYIFKGFIFRHIFKGKSPGALIQNKIEMKNLIFGFLLSMLILPLSAQEESGGALLSDLLNVQPVEYNEEGSEEMIAEYKEMLEEERSKLDEALAKLDDDYKKEVARNIDDFNKVLEDTDEQAVANEKQAMITRVRTMTMALKKNKKDEAMAFKNRMIKEIREMPMKTQPKKEKEVEDIRIEYNDKFDKEYEANMKILETFKKTQHLIKTETPADSGESEQ